MEKQYLATYLHDHASGATGALELLGRLEAKYQDHSVGPFLSALREEITWEKTTQLDALCEAFPLHTGVPRRVAAWVAEKGLELKLGLDGSSEDDFRLFESLEALSVGIAGKRLLWRTLAQEARNHQSLVGYPYKKLIKMAIRQRRALEPHRLAAASLSEVGEAGPKKKITKPQLEKRVS